ncbi:MAG: chromate efflux transporter [candidate division WOR-3 bacterium]|uniref:Chromate efflux transporter n=1 Tax=candidate division WOR-3 bacterium TaxID=2052148 RepID=A0A7C2AK19_UNCW3|nr:chromate efflux transporter [candidate division WOR-3 bacterium]
MRPAVPLRQLALVFLKIGTFGFGGGAGMLALIRQEVVEKRRWLDDTELATAVAMGQMLPGPFVSNYAEYIGYRLAGIPGMIVSTLGLLFPGFVLILLLGIAYYRYGSLPLIQKAFTGIQPVVTGILAWATWTIGRTNVRSWRSALLALISALALLLGGDILLVVLGCGLLAILTTKKPARSSRTLLLLPLPYLITGSQTRPALPQLFRQAGELALVFFKMGTVIFGGGFAAIPFLQHEVVELRGWLTTREFIDAVALGQMTPGPVALMATFIGYRVLGIPGALIATLGTFLPSALMLFGLIKGYDKIRNNPLVRSFLAGVLPAVVGMLFASTVFIARSSFTGLISVITALLTLLLLLRFSVLQPVWLIIGGALLGLISP